MEANVEAVEMVSLEMRKVKADKNTDVDLQDFFRVEKLAIVHEHQQQQPVAVAGTPFTSSNRPHLRPGN